MPLKPEAPATDWIRHVHPEIPVSWIENYYVEVDLLLAVPVWAHTPALSNAVATGRVRRIPIEEAQRLNARVSMFGTNERQFLEEKLAERWAFIKQQASQG